MKLALTAALSATAALLVANLIGVAVAEAPTTTSLRTVSVEGVGTQSIAQNADAASATAIYRQAMAAAVGDGQAKAEFLTGKAGATLGAVQTIAEDGGEIECTGGESEYVQYEGEQPDFGYAPRPNQVVAGASTPALTRPARPAQPTVKRRRKHRRPVARKATAPGCKLSARVSLVYVVG